MSDTETEVEPSAASQPPDTSMLLYTYGLSGVPVRMAPMDIAPAVAAVRAVNLSEMTPAELQPLLDQMFPDQGITADQVCIAHPPAPEIGVTVTDNAVTVTDTPDDDLELPDSHYQWSLGDGTVVSRRPPFEHRYASPDTYTIRLELVVSGRVWSDSAEVEIETHDQSVPVLTALIPDSAPVVPPTSLEEAVAGNFPLTILGENFAPEVELLWNDAVEPHRYVSSTALTTTVKPWTASGPTTVSVAVRQNGVESNELTFTFTEPVEAEAEAASEEFDPGEHTVDEVVAYANENPDEIDRLIGEEEAGKARVTLLEKLHALANKEGADATT